MRFSPRITIRKKDSILFFFFFFYSEPGTCLALASAGSAAFEDRLDARLHTAWNIILNPKGNPAQRKIMVRRAT